MIMQENNLIKKRLISKFMTSKIGKIKEIGRSNLVTDAGRLVPDLFFVF